MEYYYSGTESLWCGNWNHLVCRRWKCEVDHPSQSTEINLGKKQKWCSLCCPWSQVQQDATGPESWLWTIYHRCTCKWDWTEMLIVYFPLRAKTMKSALYEYRHMSARRRAHSYPLECRLSAGRLFRQKSATRYFANLNVKSPEMYFLH